VKSSPHWNFFQEAEAIFTQLQAWRRQIHRNPELGFKERKTAALAAKVLRAHGWEVKTQVAGTGVVGLLRGVRGQKTFGIRADMDALPIEEKSRVPYASRVRGVMHACGHDGNTTMALGAAVLLAKHRGDLSGNVKIVFQPCEEAPPGGALAMIRAGVLKNPRVDAMVAAHVDATTPAGRVALRAGAVMAATDRFVLTILGEGGHGAFPHQCVDAVAVAAEVVVGLQQLVARELDPLEPAVVTVGKIQGGTAFNIIAGSVTLEGTLRSLTPALRQDLPRRVKRIAEGICRAHRAQCRFELDLGHPALYNHTGITAAVRAAAKTVAGPAGVVELERPAMTGEDFTYFAGAVPACFFRVGGGQAAKGFVHPWHHPDFDFDERALTVGAAVLAQTAWDFLPS
jgi:amidohydrolase